MWNWMWCDVNLNIHFNLNLNVNLDLDLNVNLIFYLFTQVHIKIKPAWYSKEVSSIHLKADVRYWQSVASLQDIYPPTVHTCKHSQIIQTWHVRMHGKQDGGHYRPKSRYSLETFINRPQNRCHRSLLLIQS